MSQDGEIEIDPQAVTDTITGYTREAGVRELQRKVGALCRHVAVKVAEKVCSYIALCALAELLCRQMEIPLSMLKCQTGIAPIYVSVDPIYRRRISRLPERVGWFPCYGLDQGCLCITSTMKWSSRVIHT